MILDVFNLCCKAVNMSAHIVCTAICWQTTFASAKSAGKELLLGLWACLAMATCLTTSLHDFVCHRLESCHHPGSWTAARRRTCLWASIRKQQQWCWLGWHLSRWRQRKSLMQRDGWTGCLYAWPLGVLLHHMLLRADCLQHCPGVWQKAGV